MRTRTAKYSAAIVFTLGLVSMVVALVINHRRISAPVALKMVSSQRFVRADGKSIVQAEIKRFQRSDGSYSQFTTHYNEDGSVAGTARLLGIVGRGVFGVNEKDRQLIFQSAKRHAFHEINEEALRKDPGYIGEDTILGYRVLGQRSPDSSDVVYLAPSLGGIPLKLMSYYPDGSYMVIEPVKIELGEPTESEFGEVPAYPVDYNLYERQIADMDNQSQPELANEMRKVLKEQKAVNR